MASPTSAVTAYLRSRDDNSLLTERISGLNLHRGVRVEGLDLSVILAPTATTTKDQLAGRYNLSSKEGSVFVVPPTLLINGELFADLEFPTYLNAYVLGNIAKQKPLDVICTKEQKPILEEYIQRTIVGPDWTDPKVYPEVSKEDRTMLHNIAMHYAPKTADGSIIPLESFIRFHTFNHDGLARIKYPGKGYLKIEQRRNEYEVAGYAVTHELPNGRDMLYNNLLVNYTIPKEPLKPIDSESREQIENARYGFAISCFGNSNGFDANGYTTSFVTWMAGTGLFIDPSTDALQAAKSIGLSDTDIPLILLTHCHQDHDGGALERILQGKRVNLIASRVVYEEFMTKCENLLKGQSSQIDINPRELIEWQELNINSPTKLQLPNGEVATLNAWWNIHPIPTNGFSIEFRGKTFGHSGDTQAGEAFYDSLVEKKVLTSAQANAHRKRWATKAGIPKFDLIHFEAGGPPIHTTYQDVAQMFNPKYYDQIRLYHAPDASVEKSLIKKTGLYQTDVIIPSTEADRRAHYHSLITKQPYFAEVPDKQALLSQGEFVSFKAGEQLITQQASPSEYMYVILSGSAQITVNGKIVGRFGPGSVAGDWSHIAGASPSGTITAESNLVGFKIDLNEVLTLDQIKKFRDEIHFLREYITVFQNAFSQLGLTLNDLPNFLLRIHPALKMVTLPPNGILMRKGEEADQIFIPFAGSLKAYEEEFLLEEVTTKILGTILPGHIIGESALDEDNIRKASVRATEEGARVLSIDAEQFKILLKEYPGVMNALRLQIADRKRSFIYPGTHEI